MAPKQVFLQASSSPSNETENDQEDYYGNGVSTNTSAATQIHTRPKETKVAGIVPETYQHGKKDEIPPAIAMLSANT